MNRLKVVVLSSNEEQLLLLGRIAEDAGFDAVTAQISEVGRDEESLHEFLRRHDPRVVIYDVAAPYPDNWALFRRLQTLEQSLSIQQHFVITTPNKEALEARAGTTEAVEVVGDRSESAVIVQAIIRAIAAADACC